MLKRTDLELSVRTALGRSRAVVLNGPRQSGKTTIARTFLSRDSPNYFDLENPLHAQRLAQPQETLSQLQGLVVIDEVQRSPGLFPLLRTLIDRSDAPGQYLLLGSASPLLLRQTGESLLGRIETVEVSGFNLQEVCGVDGHYSSDAATRLWLRGGFPRAYLAGSDQDSLAWRAGAIASHVEVDLPQFGVNVAPSGHAAILAHARALSWPDMDCIGSGAITGCVRAHGAPLSGHPDTDTYDPPAPALA